MVAKRFCGLVEYAMSIKMIMISLNHHLIKTTGKWALCSVQLSVGSTEGPTEMNKAFPRKVCITACCAKLVLTIKKGNTGTIPSWTQAVRPHLQHISFVFLFFITARYWPLTHFYLNIFKYHEFKVRAIRFKARAVRHLSYASCVIDCVLDKRLTHKCVCII